MRMSNYRNLQVWDDACFFARDIYRAFSQNQDYGLKDQITRSAVSVASNIAEGSDRGTDKEFSRFLRISKASCEECRTQLKIALLIGYLDQPTFEDFDTKAKSIAKRIGSLIKYLNPRP